jgi:hypothetical protein
MAAFPYVTDVFNAVFGTHWNLPIPTFGIIVAIAVVLATSIAIRVVKGYEELGKLPPGTKDDKQLADWLRLRNLHDAYVYRSKSYGPQVRRRGTRFILPSLSTINS